MVHGLLIGLAALAGAHTPHDAVLRFIENHSPQDACAQLAPEYQAALAKQYGPCLAGMQRQPKASRIRVFDEQIRGRKATVDASYNASGGHFKERYTLIHRGGAWLITGSRQIP